MDQRNVTRITTIQLLGFQIPPCVTILVFLLLLMMYCVTICGNLMIITLVTYTKSLHSPMYFFLSHLSLLDILLVTDILPNMISTMISTILVKKTLKSFSDCLAQFYFLVITESSECLLLTVMSWDRYLAICKPLHYSLKMSYQVCWILVIVCWILGIFVALVYHLTISELQFCGPNIIDHFFCDIDPILYLSCSDITAAQFEVTILGVIIVVIPFFIIIESYAYIIYTIFKIPSITGRQKVFSTCSSHLAVVCIYYGTLICVYLIPNRRQTRDINKCVSLLYTVATPMINPLIYSLRNKELKKAFAKLLQISAFQ